MSQQQAHFTDEHISFVTEELYGLAISQIKVLPSYIDLNYRLKSVDGKQYVLKIANKKLSYEVLDFENKAMQHMTTHSDSDINSPQVFRTKDNKTITAITNQQGETYYLRLLSYLPGQFVADVDSDNPVLWRNMGKFCARIDKVLKDFDHPESHRFLRWDMKHAVSVIYRYKSSITNGAKRQLVEQFLQEYENRIIPNLSELRMQVIYNDCNDHNVLVTDDANNVKGIIDFGDIVYSHLIFEIAIAAAYMLLDKADPMSVITEIAVGYHELNSLNEFEIQSLFYCVCIRLCVSVCISANDIWLKPDDKYLLVTEAPAWNALFQLQKIDPLHAEITISQACHIPIQKIGNHIDSILQYRKKHLGKNLSIAYQQPLKIIRGRGQYLYSDEGRQYLDMVNNVCHVGHCHPKVVNAAQKQIALLNTNTRYLHDNIIDYAKQLLATMPPSLDVCMFVNSGSEANELALRMAWTHTRHKNVLVVDGAYHGNTNACIDISPYKFDGPGGKGGPNWVHKVAMPDPYRGEFKGYGKKTGRRYGRSVETVLYHLAKECRLPAAYICESLQGVGGQLIMPDGYLKSAYEYVRRGGGVCIADEVQVGFGRVGSHMWAFETQGVEPDIVTLGKPIGNGHPLAAVITTQEIADSFVTGMEYFNTFGGNPVSCTIGMAVLAVIKDEKLQDNALRTGEHLKAGLLTLQEKYPVIGDVRGLGLFVGAEFVADSKTLQPAVSQLDYVVERMKEEGILLSTDGPLHNVLKIKPPMVFNQDNADFFLETLDKVMSEKGAEL